MPLPESFTIDQLAEAVRANDADRVRQILDAQPDLVRTDMAYENEHQVPATTALVIARDRGYDDIVAIIEEQENLRNPQPQPGPDSAARDQLMQAFDRNDEDVILRILEADPSLIEAHPWAASCSGLQGFPAARRLAGGPTCCRCRRQTIYRR